MNQQNILDLRQQGKTFQEIADMYGCSRQYVYQMLKNPPKRNNRMQRPTKSELYKQVDALIKENIVLQDKLDAEDKMHWMTLKDKAFEMFYELTPFNKGTVQFLTLEHIDKVGYWFTFELCNDSTRQTYCVRHTDL